MSLTDLDVAAFLELLAQQRRQYEHMREQALSDAEFFRSMPQPHELAALLERKRAAMEALAALDAELAPLVSSWAARRQGAATESAHPVDEALKAVRESLKSLITAEDAANKVAEETMLGARRRLRALASTGQAARAYGARAPSQAHFVDERP